VAKKHKLEKSLIGSKIMKKTYLTIALLQRCLVLILVLGLALCVQAQNVNPVEKGKFRLFIFAQDAGEETYEVSREGDILTTKSNFKFVDRGTEVPLTATLKTSRDFTPLAFDIKGKISRRASIDTSIQINGKTAEIREDKVTRQANVPAKFFTVAGSSPVAIQQVLFRYILANKIKNGLKTFPDGQITVKIRGFDVIKIGDKTHKLRRIFVSGLEWGNETAWLDEDNNLIATYSSVFSVAIRDGFESAYSTFTEIATADEMASLSELSNRLSPKLKGALVIKNINLIDGTGKPALNNAVIVIENGRISSIGSAQTVKIPKKAKVFDGQNKYALPGLWDMHGHYAKVEWGPTYLAAGITTARDLANEFNFIINVRKAIDEGRGLGPRILMAGLVDGDGPRSLGIIRANTPEQAREVVNRYHKAGFEQIKIYSSIKPEIVKEICKEAHRLGMTVTGHVPSGMRILEAVEAGMDEINHISSYPQAFFPRSFSPPRGEVPKVDFNSEAAINAFKIFKERNIVFDPTMALVEFSNHPARIPVEDFEPGVNKLPIEMMAATKNTGIPEANEKLGKDFLDSYSQILAALHKNGLAIVAGTDNAVLGFSLKRELELYVKAGFTPMEAIQSATIVPAKWMKKDKDLGTLETGKFADIILVEGNPLENISNLRNTKFVIANGRLFDCSTLWQSVGFKP
jgi:imidazolonepropionase-like amidohydrolase